MSIVQVTFDPTLWSGGSGSGTGWGDNGYDCFTVKPDKDGSSLWAFEAFAAGFARVHGATGTIIQQDALFGSPGFRNALDTRADGSVALWVQDANGYYYTSCYPNIYKFHIPNVSGPYTPDGTLLNGYAVIDATFEYTPYWDYIEDWTIWTTGGVTYLAGTSTHFGTGSTARIYVMNANTMTLFGTYDGTADNLNNGNMCFADKNGILWGCCYKTPAYPRPALPDAPPNDIGANLVRWNPADGATAGVLNNTSVQYIPGAVHGMAYSPFFAGYVPDSNSVILAPFPDNSSADVSVVSMDTWTRVALHLDDLKFFMAIESDENEGGFDEGVQDGLLMIEGSNAYPTQVGGLLEIIDPTTLAIQSTVDCVALIAAAGLPNQAETTTFNNIQNGYISNVDEDASGNLTITTTVNSFAVGSQVWFFNLVGASWLNTGHGGNPTMAVTSVTPTQFTGVDPFGIHGPYSGSETPPYADAFVHGVAIPPLATFAWSKPSKAVGFAFNFSGSPLYIVTLSSCPSTPMLTLVNGHVQTAGNSPIVPYGYIELYLNSDATLVCPPFGQVLGGVTNSVKFYFDANANIQSTAQILSNKEMNPVLGTYYVVNFYDSNGTRLNNNPWKWQFTQPGGSSVDISNMVSI